MACLRTVPTVPVRNVLLIMLPAVPVMPPAYDAPTYVYERAQLYFLKRLRT